MNVYGMAVFDVSTVRGWVIKLNGDPRKKGATDCNDKPVAVVNEDKNKQTDVLNTANKRNTIAKFYENRVCHGSTCRLVQSVGYSKIHAK